MRSSAIPQIPIPRYSRLRRVLLRASAIRSMPGHRTSSSEEDRLLDLGPHRTSAPSSFAPVPARESDAPDEAVARFDSPLGSTRPSHRGRDGSLLLAGALQRCLWLLPPPVLLSKTPSWPNSQIRSRGRGCRNARDPAVSAAPARFPLIVCGGTRSVEMSVSRWHAHGCRHASSLAVSVPSGSGVGDSAGRRQFGALCRVTVERDRERLQPLAQRRHPR